MRQISSRYFFAAFVLALLQAPSASAQQSGYAPPAQFVYTPGYIFGEVATAIGMRPVETPPDFVAKARPDPSTLTYVHLKPPPRDFHSFSAQPGARLLKESDAISELEKEKALAQSRRAGGSSPSNAAPPASPIATNSVENPDTQQRDWPPKWSDSE